MTPLQKAAKALINRWDLPAWKDQPHTAEYIAKLRKALDAELAQSVEPVAWLTQAGSLASAEITDLKMGMSYGWTPLYLHPPQPQATTPVPASNWLIRKEPNTKDKYYVAEGNPPANVLEIYGITQGEKP